MPNGMRISLMTWKIYLILLYALVAHPRETTLVFVGCIWSWVALPPEVPLQSVWVEPTTLLNLPKITQKTGQYYLRVTAHGKLARVSELGSPWRMIPFTPLPTTLWKTGILHELCLYPESPLLLWGFCASELWLYQLLEKQKLFAVPSSLHPEIACCPKPFLTQLCSLF